MQANEHHSMTLDGNMADWAEVLAVFAVKTAGSEDDTAMDVVTIDATRVGIIQTIFNEMNDLSDLRRISRPNTALQSAAAQLPLATFPVREWLDAANYLCGANCQSAEDARNAVLSF